MRKKICILVSVIFTLMIMTVSSYAADDYDRITLPGGTLNDINAYLPKIS